MNVVVNYPHEVTQHLTINKVAIITSIMQIINDFGNGSQGWMKFPLLHIYGMSGTTDRIAVRIPIVLKR